MRFLTPSAASRARFAGLLFGLLGALGCASEGLSPAAPITDPDAVRDVFWALQLNHRAALLSTAAPYDTLTLTATPVNMRGEPLAGLPAPVYSSSALDVVDVNSEGVVRALDVGSKVRVVASITVGNVTRKDTLLIDIVDLASPPVLTEFSADPVPPDSAKVSMTAFTTKPLQGRATDENGNPMVVPVYYSTSDASILPIDRATGALGTTRRAGQVSLYASTIAFGVAKADTVPFRVGLSLWGTFNLIEKNLLSGPKVVFEPSELRVEVGAAIRWFNLAKIEGVDIVFTDPTNVIERPLSVPPNACVASDCGRGNITNLSTNVIFFSPSAERGIFVPGVYDFYSTKLGFGGRIIVVDSDVLQ